MDVRLVWIIPALVAAGCGGKFDVTHPARGEALMAGSTTTVTWRGPDSVDAVDVWVTFADHTEIAVALGEPNDGELSWTVPLRTGDNRGRLQVVPAGAARRYPLARRSAKFADGIVDGGGEQGDGDVVVSMASLAALRWNNEAQVEEYYWIDTVTGESEVKGAVGDLHWISFRAAFVAGNDRVYVKGAPEEGPEKLYTLDAVSGAFLGDTPFPLAGGSLSGTLPDGRLLGFRFDEPSWQEQAVAISPEDGDLEVLAGVGDLYMWGEDAAVDPSGRVAYAWGVPADSEGAKLYAMDLDSGELLSRVTPTWAGYSGFTASGSFVTREGGLFACVWNDAEQTEYLVQFDPETGTGTSVAAIGDLHWWSGLAAWNPTNDEVYVFGRPDGVGYTNMYVLDAAAGEFLYQTEVVDAPTAAVLAY